MNSKHQSTAPAEKQMEAEAAGQAAESAIKQPVSANVVLPVPAAKPVVDLEAKARADRLREENRVRAPNPGANQPVAAGV